MAGRPRYWIEAINMENTIMMTNMATIATMPKVSVFITSSRGSQVTVNTPNPQRQCVAPLSLPLFRK